LSRLDGLVVVVTGGAGDGIGRGISAEVVKAGARLVILDIDTARSREIVATLGADRACSIETDVSIESAVAAAFEQIGREYQQVDVLINSAGIGLIRAPHETTAQEFNRLVAVDLQGTWLTCKYAIPLMLRQGKGSIVNIGSVHGTATLADYSLYAAVKAGVAGFTRGLALQYGRNGIRANSVAPGLVDGSQTRAVLRDLGHDPEPWMTSFLGRHQALQTPIVPEDIGRAVVFLASDDARAITGVDLAVDAGALAQLSSRD
jgi:NAD(P)-dependent dehydrogenase (short-subunit alcohol dehydrogenase family)